MTDWISNEYQRKLDGHRMSVLGSLLLGMAITVVALALAILFILILVIGAGTLGTRLEKSIKKSPQRKKSPARKADIITLAPQATRAPEPQNRSPADRLS